MMLSLEKSVPLLGLAPCAAAAGADISTLLTNTSPQLSAIGLDSNMYIVLSGCAAVPGLPCVGIPGGTLCCACYQSFPAAPAPPAPCTAVAAATIPTVTPITAGYPRQPLATAALPQHPPNGTFHPTALPSVGQLHGAQTVPHLRPSYPQQQQQQQQQQQNSRGPSPGFHNHKFRSGFGRSLLGFHPKGLKRKADDALSTDSADSGNGRSDGSTASGEAFVYPLYCKVCRVTLNAPAQAKQHYEGKSHAKKVKLTDSSNNNNGVVGGGGGAAAASNGSNNNSNSNNSPGHATNSNNSLDQPPVSPKEAPLPPPEINPEIYCKLCGVSFNSNKQAQQHYQGKNHAKKTRVSDGDKVRGGHRRGFRYRCYLCNLHLGSKEHLLIHLRGPQHQEKLKAQRITNRGQWAMKNRDLPNGVPFGIRQLDHRTPATPSNRYNNTYHHGNGSMTGNKSAEDLSLYRTPSGGYYCPSCNVTVSSDSLFTQHLDSRKHRILNSPQQSKLATDGTSANLHKPDNTASTTS